jgi:hypothetical protein
MIASCRCGARWQQIGNATGHCAGCHNTFSSLAAFDAHFHGVSCVNPALVTRDTGEPMFVAETGGAQPYDGVIWRLVPTQKQREALERLRERRKATIGDPR